MLLHNEYYQCYYNSNDNVIISLINTFYASVKKKLKHVYLGRRLKTYFRISKQFLASQFVEHILNLGIFRNSNQSY